MVLYGHYLSRTLERGSERHEVLPACLMGRDRKVVRT